MSSRHIIDQFAAAREGREALVLVTVYETLGSTYSKAGGRMLITAGGKSQGLVSGGCLEGDLVERARRVLAEQRSATVTYDLRDEADELFGLGVGCNGLIRVVLQPLGPETHYEPMASIADALLGDSVAALATVIESRLDSVPVGASLAWIDDRARAFGLDAAATDRLVAGCRASAANFAARLVSESDLTVLYAPLLPVPKLLILGAGLDAVPLVNVAAELGWRVSLADHRPAYLERGGFERVEDKRLVDPRRLTATLDPDRYDAVVVMSHHLDTDREYLRALAAANLRYIGLLGPPARRRRLIDEIGESGGLLDRRLRGPVGIDIKADTAETIALSIAAEIQSVLSMADASGLRRTS